MPQGFLVYLAVAMLVNVAAAAVMLRRQARVAVLLRARHPHEWERLGRPRPWFRGFRMPTTYEWREHRALGDPALDRVCAGVRSSTAVSVGLSVAAVAGLLFW